MTDKSSTFDQLTNVETRLASIAPASRKAILLSKCWSADAGALVRYINQQTIALLKANDLSRPTSKPSTAPRR